MKNKKNKFLHRKVFKVKTLDKHQTAINTERPALREDLINDYKD